MELNKVQFWPAQKDFFESGPSPILFFGGVGSGKTYIGILRLLYLLDQYPGSRGAIVRQRFQQLKKTTAATLWKLLPRDQIRSKNENDGTVRLKNGSEIVLLHLDKTDSINNLKSLEINFAYVDQLEDLSVDAWDTLIERVGRWSGATKRGGWPKKWPYRNRLGDPIPPRYVFASAYSPGYEHWITARWWEHGIEREKYRKKGYRVVFGSTRENLALSQEYVDDRLAMGSEYVRRFVDAQEWGANEGRIFTLDSMSILEPNREFFEYMRRRMKLHRVYDHGDFSPAACLWYATDAHGNVFFYREYQQKDKLVSEHRRAIFELSKDDGFGATGPNYYSNLADPIIFAKSRGRTTTAGPSWSVADEFLDRRLIEPETAVYWRPADNNEEMTISRVKEYLRVDPRHKHPITGKYGAPRVYFIRKTDEYPNGLDQTIIDIRAAKRIEVGQDANGNKLYSDKRDDKVPDHCLDCVRYSLAGRPALARLVNEAPLEPGTMRFSDYEKMTRTDNFYAERKQQEDRRRPYGSGW